MGRVLAGRLTQAAATLVVLSIVVHALMGLMPGDPIDAMLAADPRMTPEDAARLRALHGLDQPLWRRWLAWAEGAVQGEFGYSRLFARPVAEIVAERLAVTAILVGTALAAALALATPLGLIAADRAGGRLDRALDLAAFAGAATPSFVTALALIYVFAVTLGLLPAGAAAAVDPGAAWDERFAAWALPVASLTLALLPSYLRQARAAAGEALASPWARFLRAKRVSRARILWVHAPRNAAIPVVTVAALDMGTLVSGAVVIETIFGLPGMGRAIHEAALGSDFPLALALLTAAGAGTLLAALAADLAVAALDPRIRRP